MFLYGIVGLRPWDMRGPQTIAHYRITGKLRIRLPRTRTTRGAIGNVLRRRGIPPAPKRSQNTS